MELDEATPIALSRAEALVLFDYLHRLEDQKVRLPDPAEQIAVWALSASLERVLVEPFREDYGSLVEAARSHLTANQ
jgi:hypothetical protein